MDRAPHRCLVALALLALPSCSSAPFECGSYDIALVRSAGDWIPLFDGESLNGWQTSAGKPSQRPVEDGCLNPHRSGDYMLVHEKKWSDFELSLEFRLPSHPPGTTGTNSGVFFRVKSLEVSPGLDVGYNGLEVAIDDTAGAGFHDTGAIYDLVKPSRNAMRPAGEWNHLHLTCDRNRIEVALNGETVTRMDFDEWTQPERRPDGSSHKFKIAYRDHPREGYIGLQDHGGDIWFRNIRIKPLPQ
jgi:hypothetical protein